MWRLNVFVGNGFVHFIIRHMYDLTMMLYFQILIFNDSFCYPNSSLIVKITFNFIYLSFNPNMPRLKR